MLAKRIFLGGKILVSVSLVAWLVFSGRFQLPHLDPATAALALAFVAFFALASLYLQGVRWWLLVRIHGIDLGYWQAARMFWISQFYAIFLPGAVGGDLVRGYYIFRHAPTTRFAGATSILVDRAAGLLAFVVLAVAAFAAAAVTGSLPPMLAQVGWLATLSLLTAIAVLLLTHRAGMRIAVRLPKRWRCQAEGLVMILHAQTVRLAGVFLVSLVSAACMLVAFLGAAAAIGVSGGFQILLAAPAVVVANNLPISLGGLGVGEAAAAVLFGQIGIAEGAAIMILVRAGLLLWRLGGAALLMMPERRPLAVGAAAE